jgi:acyl transferase domain-containing protein/NADPH-dependent curcumin reductase CurA/acyl carrier protein
MSDEMNAEEITQQLLDALVALEDMQATLDAEVRARTEPIAIVGIGCRFPGGGDGPEAFWNLVRDGRDAVGDVPAGRWDANAYHDADRAAPGKMVSRRGAFVDGIDEFDAEFFDLFPREAALLDPQQRLFLQTAWEALEDAAIPADRLAGTKTGVFVGACTMDYALLQFRDAANIEAYSSVGCSPAVLANRLSYALDLKGPSVTVDTACSSSLVAAHLAAASLRQGETNLAIVGGVNAILAPDFGISFSKLGLLSPDGRCRTFDTKANGYVRGEGCGVVVLKRLSDAQASGDRVWAVLRATAINQDGRTNGITAPNGTAQVAVMREALERASVRAADVSYIEAHGIGTAIGDAIEMDALKEVYGAPAAGGTTCYLGSVKPNIGHLEGAAGIAALIKTALCLREQAIPRVTHFESLNPEVALDPRFTIPTELVAWPVGATPRRAAVSAFGFGGTNAHAIIEEAPTATPRGEPEDRPTWFALPISARSSNALRELAGRWSTWLTDTRAPQIEDVCLTAAVGRTHHEYREVVVGRSNAELMRGLQTLHTRPASAGPIGAQPVGAGARLAWLCAGDALPWPIGATPATSALAFVQMLEACDAIWKPLAGWSLLDELRRDAGQRTRAIAGPFRFALQVAHAGLLHTCGVRPDVIVGRGFGEISAAHIAGIITLEEALLLVQIHARAATDEVRLPEGTVRPRAGTLPYLSMTVGGIVRGETLNPHHLAAHGLEHVADAVTWLAENQFSSFLELVPDDASSAELVQALVSRGRAVTLLPSLRSDATERELLIETLAALYREGRDVEWGALAGTAARRTRMPTYPWQPRRLWFGNANAHRPSAPAASSPTTPRSAPVRAPHGRVVDPFATRPFQLQATRKDQIEGLELVDCAHDPVGPGQVKIAVRAAGLNFRDVLRVLGVYPGAAPGDVDLGDECAGYVVAVGDGVDRFAVGDHVVALAPHCFGSHVATSAALVWHVPARLTATDAAGIPIVFGTAYHALHDLARLQPGERVLIHSATGGVGLAAIQIARWKGAEIYATAGTPTKRAFLASLGITHVMDSRTLDFADDVMRHTGGQGVDVVLNSLTGEALARGLALLRTDGRFIEIGKRDIHANLALGLEPFRRRLTFCHLDLGSMLRDRVPVVSALVRDVLQHFEVGTFTPLPTRVLPIRDAAGAFVDMAQARHIGKIVFAVHEDAPTKVTASCEVAARPGAPTALRDEVLRLAPNARIARVEQLLVEHLARTLQVDGSTLDGRISLRDLGLDSLMTLELRTTLAQRLGVTLSVVKLASLPSLSKVAEYAAEKLAAAGEPTPSTCEAEPAATAPDEALRDTLLALPPDARTLRLEALLVEHLSRTLQLEPQKLDGRMSLRDLGLDSLMTLELRTSLKARLGITLSVVKLSALPTLRSIAEYAQAKLAGDAHDAPEARS